MRIFAFVLVRNEIPKLVSRLIQIPSVNPPGYTRSMAEEIKAWLSERGFTAELREYVRDKPNVIARVGRGGPILILNAHMDVVPPGDEDKWLVPPFSGSEIEGRIYGRGACDDKGGLAVIMAVFAELGPIIEKEGVGTLVLAATADEETGGKSGVGALVNDGVLKGDAAIIAEPSTSRSYCIGEKGLCQLKFKAYGRSAHGSMPILGENAIIKLVKAIEKAQLIVEELNRGLKFPLELEEAVNATAELERERARSHGIELPIEDFKAVLTNITFSPGVIKGGVKVNVVPDYAECEIDIRIPPGYSPNGLIDNLKANIGGLVEIEPIDISEPNYTRPDEHIVRIIHESIREVLNVDPRPALLTGATDGRYFRAVKIPTVIYGPGDPMLAHAYNEYIAVRELFETYDVMIKAIRKFFGLES